MKWKAGATKKQEEDITSAVTSDITSDIMQVAFLRVRTCVDTVDEHGMRYKDTVSTQCKHSEGVLNPDVPTFRVRYSYELSDLPRDVDNYIIERIKEEVQQDMESEGEENLEYLSNAENCEIEEHIQVLQQKKAAQLARGNMQARIERITTLNQISHIPQQRRKSPMLDKNVSLRTMFQWLLEYGWKLKKAAMFGEHVMEYMFVME